MNPWEKGMGEHFRTVKPRISAENLVGAFSGDRHRVPLLNPPAEIQQRRIDVRLPRKVPCERRRAEQPRDFICGSGQNMMTGAEIVRHVDGIFVVALRLEKTAFEILPVALVFKRIGIKRHTVFSVIFRRNGADDGGIESAGEQGAQRYVRYELTADGVFQQEAGIFDDIGTAVPTFARRELPVSLDGQRAVFPYRLMCGLDFTDPLENTADPVGREEQKLPKADFVYLRPDAGIPEQCLDFGSKDERISRNGIKQWLDAEAVTCEIGFVQRRVIYRESKDAVEHGSAFFPEKDIEV